MIISEHAQRAMEQDGISEEEVRVCVQHGKRVIKQQIRGEMRYGNEMGFKDKKIMVIYTKIGSEERIITAYPVRRKKEW